MPNIQLNLVNHLKTFANTSIDISDGILADLNKMINDQKLSFTLNYEKIPVSKNLKKVRTFKKFSKINCI
mgnify:FL=1